MAELHHTHAGHADHPAVHHEESDVNIGAILTFAAGLIVASAVIAVVVGMLFRFLDSRAAQQPQPDFPLAAGQENRLPPEPRLQTNPREDLRDLRSLEDETLTTYSWVDKNAGIVRIPIDEAMKLAIQRGLPAKQGTNK